MMKKPEKFDLDHPIAVVSLFDGMSCGQIAFNKIGAKIDKYFASEIKTIGIKVTQDNYSNTIQLGDITKIDTKLLSKVDFLIGGSPCQDFSSANANRLGLKGEKSKLFYEYVRILKEVNPRFFLLENVKMDEWQQRVISEILGVEPIEINSNLVSAQNRNRLYWTNIDVTHYPQDQGVEFKDILTSGWVTKRKAQALLESESRPNTTRWKRFRRWRKWGFINIVFTTKDLNLFKNRYLDQTELEKLQTVPVGYTRSVTRHQAASLLGDGWTVDVIAHIFSFAFNDCESPVGKAGQIPRFTKIF